MTSTDTTSQALRRDASFNGILSRSLLRQLLLPTFALGIIIIAIVSFYTPAAVIDSALDEAVVKGLQTADQMRALRAFYSANVVARAVKGGGKASATYKMSSTEIPVPTTFILDVAEAFSTGDVKLGLVSPYPWPTRAGRVLDAFQRDAWERLRVDPSAKVVRRERVNGREVLRVAVGDRMDASCVACHNSDPRSPKTDWKVGDVRGLIEIDRPIDQITKDARRLTWRLTAALGLAGLMLFIALSVVALRLVRPLRHLASLINRIASGSLDDRVPHTDRSDELGTVARALSNLQEQTVERLRAEARISHMARHDELTGLPNRASFQAEIGRALQVARAASAVLCLDLDRFKAVNDTLGHVAGDTLLRIVGERLGACVCDGIFVARNGGDEFAIVQTLGEQPVAATSLAERVIALLSAPYDLDGQQVTIGVSIGIALAPSDGSSAEELIKNADLALYRAKGEGRGTKRFFEREMDAQMQARRKLELDLRSAVVNDELELFYQPLVTLRSDKVCGFEALLRWHHPERGLVPPNDFIPLAEETGEIEAIGVWVLKTACREAATWPKDIKVAVNLSPVQFRSGTLALHVVNALAASGLSPARLELEITESVMLQDTQGTLKVLHELRATGVRISMDDFGTGYSSLSYLRKFPFDKIKIDQSFIRDLSDKTDAAAIIKAVMDLGSGLGMSTTAEGVETEAQLLHLRQKGCDEVQGYLISPPRPAKMVAQMLATRWPGSAEPERLIA